MPMWRANELLSERIAEDVAQGLFFLGEHTGEPAGTIKFQLSDPEFWPDVPEDASAFIHRPDAIVVDEPMVGLDPKAAKILKDMFREYVQRGHTIIMSTHTLEVAQAMCDRVCIMQNGGIRASGTMDELRADAATTAGLEEIFLKLTGDAAARRLIDVLDA